MRMEHTQNFRRDPVRSIARAAVARGMAMLDRSLRADEHAARMWSFDTDTLLLTRAATAPNDLTNTAALAEISLAVLPMLAPYSAAAQMFQQGLNVTFGRYGAFAVPNLGQVGVAFVADGAPKPVVQSVGTSSLLDPHKIAGIAVASIELFSQPSIETIMQNLLAESAGPVLDAAVFSNAAATSARPAGLLNGIAALTATGAGTEAMGTDIKLLGTAIAPVAGGSRIALIMNATQAITFAMKSYREAPNAVVLAGNVPAGTVIAVVLNAVVGAVGVPAFDASTQATLHMDTAPAAIVSGGTVATPVISTFQSANVAVKMVLDASWVKRSASGVAWMQNVNW